MVYDLGLRLKKLRQKKGLTQKRVGNILNISPQSISGYERNLVPPSIEHLKSFALLYGVTSDYLLGLDERKILVIDCKTPERALFMEKMFNLLQSELNR